MYDWANFLVKPRTVSVINSFHQVSITSTSQPNHHKTCALYSPFGNSYSSGFVKVCRGKGSVSRNSSHPSRLRPFAQGTTYYLNKKPKSAPGTPFRRLVYTDWRKPLAKLSQWPIMHTNHAENIVWLRSKRTVWTFFLNAKYMWRLQRKQYKAGYSYDFES